MDWTTFIFAILEWIRECIAERNRESVERDLNRGGARIAGPIRRVLRKQGLRGRALREETHAVMDELAAMQPVDIEDLVDDALEDPDEETKLQMKGHGQ